MYARETAYHKAGTTKAKAVMASVRDGKWAIRRRILTGFLQRTRPNDWADVMQDMNQHFADRSSAGEVSSRKDVVLYLENVLAAHMTEIRQWY